MEYESVDRKTMRLPEVQERAILDLAKVNPNIVVAVFAGSAIIALITFGSFIGGFCLGKRYGVKLANKASVIGGIIFIFIGIEVFVSSLI